MGLTTCLSAPVDSLIGGRPPMRKLTLFSRKTAANLTLKAVAALAVAVAVGLSSCATRNQQKPSAEPAKFVMYHWEGDGIQGVPSIIIYLDTQKAEFYRGKKMVGWTYVATGKPSHPTPSGNFRIIEKTPDKISNL